MVTNYLHNMQNSQNSLVNKESWSEGLKELAVVVKSDCKGQLNI